MEIANWEEHRYLYLCWYFSLLVSIFDWYLDYRQRGILKNKNTKLPSILSDQMTLQEFESSKDYSIDRSDFKIFSDLFSTIKSSMFLFLFMTPYMVNFSSSLVDQYCPFSLSALNKEWLTTVIYTLISSNLDTLIDLPFSLYSQFVIEEKHGFNKMTIGFYFKDLVKKMAVSFIIQAPILWIVIWAITSTGDYFVYIKLDMGFIVKKSTRNIV